MCILQHMVLWHMGLHAECLHLWRESAPPAGYSVCCTAGRQHCGLCSLKGTTARVAYLPASVVWLLQLGHLLKHVCKHATLPPVLLGCQCLAPLLQVEQVSAAANRGPLDRLCKPLPPEPSKHAAADAELRKRGCRSLPLEVCANSEESCNARQGWKGPWRGQENVRGPCNGVAAVVICIY